MKKIRWIIVLFILLCAGAYLGITYYYMDGFSFGTWINGTYCTGKSVEEVNEELLLQQTASELTVIFPINEGEEAEEEERKSSHFVLDGEMLQADYTRALQRLLQGQRPLLWARNLFLPPGGYVLKPAVTLTKEGEAQFEKQFLADGTVQAELSREACIRLEKDEKEGVRLYDGRKNRFDAGKALLECVNAIRTGEERILLSQACYYDEEPGAAEKEQEKLYQELCEFLDFEIFYDMGAEQVRFDRKALLEMLETETVPDVEEKSVEAVSGAEGKSGETVPGAEEKSVEAVSGAEGKSGETAPGAQGKSGETASVQNADSGYFVFARTETGGFIWDEEKIKTAIETLAERYDTYGKPRKFTMTGGGTVTLEKGNYGTELDKKAEIKWLSEALTARKDAVRTPVYLREAYARGENDIGDTYIEINMTKQKLWFYLDGKTKIETPIVTGDMLRRRSTPEGVYYVYGKQTNRILRGPGYASHVNYWMPVKGGVGIHDALWRKEFGGDIYKKEGSHGCINLPLEAAEKLYGLIEIGVPVVMYYE